MARPKKATVDYFPHMTEHGSTIFILQSRWGNDGYAAWFKILERLGATDGLFIDCRKTGAWHFLQAYTGVSEQMLTDMLDTLADLGKIDKALWCHRVIYCQKLTDGVVDAFRKRLNNLPTRAGVFLACELAPEFPAEVCPQNGTKGTKSEQTGGRSTEREREREREITLEIFLLQKVRDAFDVVYEDYPRKDGRKESKRHYDASVKTIEDVAKISNALDNYLEEVKSTEKRFIKTAKVWFNNWKDFTSETWREEAAQLKTTWEAEYADSQPQENGSGTDD
jgi:hypothetical protein